MQMAISRLVLLFLLTHGDLFGGLNIYNLILNARTGLKGRCSLNIVFFPRILEKLPSLPREQSAAIGCTKNFQPIGVTVHSYCVGEL